MYKNENDIHVFMVKKSVTNLPSFAYMIVYIHSMFVFLFLCCQEQDEDLNYAALSLDKKKSRRPVRNMREEEPNVIYAATR